MYDCDDLMIVLRIKKTIKKYAFKLITVIQYLYFIYYFICKLSL